MNLALSSLLGIRQFGTFAKVTGILYAPGPGTPLSFILLLKSLVNDIPLRERLFELYAPGPGTILLDDKSSKSFGPEPI